MRKRDFVRASFPYRRSPYGFGKRNPYRNNKKDKQILNKEKITALIEALESDNLSAIRQLGKEWKLDSEALLVHLTEAAGIVYATKKEPTRSEFFSALLLVGRELDSPGIAWGILERRRRENLAENKKKLFG